MPNGSSTCTPISSMPSRKNARMTSTGTVAHPSSFHDTKGRNVSHTTRNLGGGAGRRAGGVE
jgi:hypothetical protein